MPLLQAGSFLSVELLLVVALTVIPSAIGLLFVIRDKRTEDESEQPDGPGPSKR